MNIKNKIN